MKYDVGGAPPLCPMFTRGRRDKGGVWFAVCAVCCVLCAAWCVWVCYVVTPARVSDGGAALYSRVQPPPLTSMI